MRQRYNNFDTRANKTPGNLFKRVHFFVCSYNMYLHTVCYIVDIFLKKERIR
jgi:hypothetical protein